ncbi:acetyl-CoA acetyltransferase [Rhodothalassium salexigens]|uniref:acetyl-CoA C-acetyltransferase n=1 Tax=Rhodothalassium salexigens TaxID=1086 RepID=UPI00191376F1|nr:acetyl-CoA C-acetyltransferase [Rhodothalassium salexigens]MBK5920630.1 acetyl-CoA acetyltransferase [Rhodothalassium salexigens]
MTDVFVYDAVRSPRGKGRPDGKLHEITPTDLASQVLAGVRTRNHLPENSVDDVYLGCVAPVGEQGADIARTAVLASGIGEATGGVQMNRFCASGLEAINTASGHIAAGAADLVIGGGVEHMSRVPMGADGGAWPSDPAQAIPSYFVPQGISADLIATKYGFSRDDVDAYAVESQKRAKAAWDDRRFAGSILPIRDVIGEPVLDHDEHMRPETDMQSLAALKPSFAALGEQMPGFDKVAIQRYPEIEKINHVHHAGNSSGIVDGSAAVLLGNRDAGAKYDLKPRARIKAFASVGSEPTIMLTGPEFAANKALGRAGMTKDDIDVWELNEAFASVVLRFMQALDIDHGDINVNGGAIAMGHPLGATGAMIFGTVLDELERSGKGTALVTLCIGAGMGTATIIERV